MYFSAVDISIVNYSTKRYKNPDQFRIFLPPVKSAKYFLTCLYHLLPYCLVALLPCCLSNHTMLKIGLTGGIGSGKSTVARIFEQLGVPVYYADTAAKRIMNEDPILKAELIRNFGSDVYLEGKLNRAYLGAIVFKDKHQLELLNALVHPATIRDSNRWMNEQRSPYAIKEAALIFESFS